MKKLLAILMALAMLFSFAACNKDKDEDEKDETTAVSADAGNVEAEKDDNADKEAIFAATEEYYAAILSCKGQKIKNAMPSVYAEIIAKEDVFASLTEDEKAMFETFYGIDLSSDVAAYEFMAIALLSELGDVDDISVENVEYEKLTAAELKEENDSIVEEGITGYEFEDGATGEAELRIIYADGTEDTITQKLAFYKENGVWKVSSDDEAEENAPATDAPSTDVPAVDTPATSDAAINAAVTEYYNAVLSGNGTRIKNSISISFDKMIAIEDPFAGMTATEIQDVKDAYGIDINSPTAFYELMSAMLLSEYPSEIAAVSVTSFDYEEATAEEVAELNAELSAEGIAGVNITAGVYGDVNIVITFADGTTQAETQFITMLQENGAWKVFPEM